MGLWDDHSDHPILGLRQPAVARKVARAGHVERIALHWVLGAQLFEAGAGEGGRNSRVDVPRPDPKVVSEELDGVCRVEPADEAPLRIAQEDELTVARLAADSQARQRVDRRR